MQSYLGNRNKNLWKFKQELQANFLVDVDANVDVLQNAVNYKLLQLQLNFKEHISTLQLPRKYM